MRFCLFFRYSTLFVARCHHTYYKGPTTLKQKQPGIYDDAIQSDNS